MKWSESHRCWRATNGDAHYGPACPRCSNPKDDQALYCRACHLELRTIPERTICPDCQKPKDKHADRCASCAARAQPRDELGRFTELVPAEGLPELTGAVLSPLRRSQDVRVAGPALAGIGAHRAS